MAAENEIPVAIDALADLSGQLNEAAKETIRRAWRHFQAHGSWPSFPQLETGVVRALPPRTNLVTALHQTPRWAGWLGSPGHPSAITVMLLAIAAVVGRESASVLRNFWRTFELARTKYLNAPEDQKPLLTSDEVMGRLGMSQLEASQVFALLRSEAVLGGGSTSGEGEQQRWAFEIAGRIHDFRDAGSLAAYLEMRRQEEIAIPGSLASSQTSQLEVASGPREEEPKSRRSRVASTGGKAAAKVDPKRERPRTPRRAVPSELAGEVMFKADRTCCVCRKRRRSVQIHHLDENPANNSIDNLVALCLLCHDDTQITGGFGRKLNRELIVRYRNQWYEIVTNLHAGLAKKPRGRAKSADRTGTRVNKEALHYLETLKAAVDRITLELNSAYQAGRQTGLSITDYLTEFDRSKMLLSDVIAQLCEDCYIEALRLTAALNNEPRINRAIHDRHKKFMAASLAVRNAIVREARARRGLA